MKRQPAVRVTDIDIMTEVLKEANRLAFGGDGSADRLREQLAIFEAGRNRSIPGCWDRFVKAAEETVRERLKKADPEYAEYTRLKAKFEGNSDEE